MLARSLGNCFLNKNSIYSQKEMERRKLRRMTRSTEKKNVTML
jgi:hypothetical protein